MPILICQFGRSLCTNSRPRLASCDFGINLHVHGHFRIILPTLARFEDLATSQGTHLVTSKGLLVQVHSILLEGRAAAACARKTYSDRSQPASLGFHARNYRLLVVVLHVEYIR